jgi:hypothetical protein
MSYNRDLRVNIFTGSTWYLVYIHRKYFTRLKDFSFELLYEINVNGMSKGEARYFKLHIFHGRWRYRMSNKICNSRFSYKIRAKLLKFKK